MNDLTPVSVGTAKLDRDCINRVIRRLAADYEKGAISLEEFYSEVGIVSAISGHIDAIHENHEKLDELVQKLNRSTVRILNGG